MWGRPFVGLSWFITSSFHWMILSSALELYCYAISLAPLLQGCLWPPTTQSGWIWQADIHALHPAGVWGCCCATMESGKTFPLTYYPNGSSKFCATPGSGAELISYKKPRLLCSAQGCDLEYLLSPTPISHPLPAPSGPPSAWSFPTLECCPRTSWSWSKEQFGAKRCLTNPCSPTLPASDYLKMQHLQLNSTWVLHKKEPSFWITC